MSRTFDFIFYPKKPRDYDSGPVKLYLRFTVEGKRSETATALSIDPEKWENGRMKGHKEESRTFNAYLDTLIGQLYDCHKMLLEKGADITADALKNEFTGKGERPRFLVEIMKAHNDNLEKLIGNGFTRTTLKKYKTTLSHLQEFVKWKYRVADISLAHVKYEFIGDLEFYLKSEKKIAHNTTAKYIKNIKKIINECVAKGWLKTNPFTNYKISFKNVDRIFLSESELDKLRVKEFAIGRVDQVRDIFLFSCYTGLSFTDVANLTPHHIAIGMDKEKWIFTKRQKTDTASHIPLLPPAIEIINKYKTHPVSVNKGKLLPMLSNQKMNSYLKEIADLCGIRKNLTFHVARHTFATTVTLTNGVPIETVSKMLGHKKIQTTQHYAKILDNKISHDMQILKGKMVERESAMLRPKVSKTKSK